MHDPGVKKGGILAALFACPNAQAVQEALPNFKQKRKLRAAKHENKHR